MSDRRVPLVFAAWLAAAVASSWFAVWSQQGASRHNRAVALLNAPSRWVAALRNGATSETTDAPSRASIPESSPNREAVADTDGALTVLTRIATVLTSQPLAAALPLALGELTRHYRLVVARVERRDDAGRRADRDHGATEVIEFPLGVTEDLGRLCVAADGALTRADRLGLQLAAQMIGLAVVADTARHAAPSLPPPADFTETVAEDLAALVEQLGAATSALPADVGGAQDALRQAEGLARLSLAEVRHSVLASMVESVQHRGVVAGVRDLLEQLRRDLGIYYSFRHNIERSLPPMIEAGVFGIAQSALKLIAEQAQPTEIRLTLESRDGAVRLVIDDDGLDVTDGYPNDHRLGPPGALGMREYAKLLGGSVAIQPRPIGGNRIEARLPVNAMFVA